MLAAVALLLSLQYAPGPALPGGAIRDLPAWPAHRRLGWSVDLQGVTHDSSAWFFTQKTVLWRVPVRRDLTREPLTPAQGVRRAAMPLPLTRAGYRHFGALAYHDGLLLVPVTGHLPAIIALFRARDFAYLGHFELPAQHGAGWLAVAPGGLVYSSDNHVDGARGIYAYALDWALAASGTLPAAPGRRSAAESARVALQPVRTIPLLDGADDPVRLVSMQGGVFDDAGRLYTMNGYCAGTVAGTGISVFQLAADTARLVGHSSTGAGPFAFVYHPGHHGLFWCREEPEGLTLWDLDDGRAPGIRGQLHALMIDNSIWDFGALSFRHYRIEPAAGQGVPLSGGTLARGGDK